MRTIKMASGRVTVEFKRAVEPAEVITLLIETVAKLRAEQGGDADAA